VGLGRRGRRGRLRAEGAEVMYGWSGFGGDAVVVGPLRAGPSSCGPEQIFVNGECVSVPPFRTNRPSLFSSVPWWAWLAAGGMAVYALGGRR